MLRNTRSKLMNMLFYLVMTIFNFLFFDTFLKRQTNLKRMLSVSSIHLC
jgi:hypothetical protein